MPTSRKAAAGRALDATVNVDQGLAQERRHRHARRLRFVLRRQAHRARRTQPAHRRDDQDRRSEGAQVPGWQSAQGCAKLADLFTGRQHDVAGPTQAEGCLAQPVERRPYKANVGSSILSAPTRCAGSRDDVAQRASGCITGVVVQLVRIPACHAGGRGFESRPLRQHHRRANLGEFALVIYVPIRLAERSRRNA